MGWAYGAYGWGEGVYRVLVGKPEGKRPLGRPRCRWVDNIRMDLQEVGCGYMDWIGLTQDRDRWRTLVSAVMNLWVPWNAGNFLTSCKPVSFSRRTLHRGVSKVYILELCYTWTKHTWWRQTNLQAKFKLSQLTRQVAINYCVGCWEGRPLILWSSVPDICRFHRYTTRVDTSPKHWHHCRIVLHYIT